MARKNKISMKDAYVVSRRKPKKRKYKGVSKALNYIARILAIIMLLFFTLMAFDTPFLSLGFLIHLLPALILLITLMIAWSNRFFGSFFYFILFFISMVFFNTYREFISFLLVSFPFFLVSICLYFSYFFRGK